MKITVLSAAALNVLGGQEIAAIEFARGLARLGHNVTFVVGRGPRGAAANVAPVNGAAWQLTEVPSLPASNGLARLLAAASGRHPSAVAAASFWLASRAHPAARRASAGADAVLAFEEIVAVAASRSMDVPVVYWYPGPVSAPRLASARRDRISLVAVSNSLAADHAAYARTRPLPPVRGVVIPGVPDEWVAEGPAPGSDDALPLTVCVARMDDTPSKGLDVLLDAWRLVTARVPGARLAILGAGALRPVLQARVRTMRLDDIVSLPGGIPRDQLRDWLRSAGLFVMPSRYESFGIAAAEAMAVGLPIVATDLPALHENVGDAAEFVAVDDPTELAAAIVHLLTDPAERRTLAARGPARVLSRTWSTQARELERHLLAAVSKAGPPGPGRA